MATGQAILAIANYGDFETDVLTVLNANKEVMTSVANQEARYRAIDVPGSMKKLATVGELLSVAYMGSKGFKCNVHVTTLMAEYQTLGKDSQIACQEFLMACMQALKYHRMAFQLVQKLRPGNALKLLGTISKIAEEMSVIAGDLAKRAERMCTLAKEALVAASQDNVISTERQQRIKQQIADLEVQAAKYTETAASLATSIAEAKEGEDKAARQADAARKDAFAIALVGTIMGPLKEVTKTAVKSFVPGGAIKSFVGAAMKDPSIAATSGTSESKDTASQPQSPAQDASTESPEITKLTEKITEKKGLLAKNRALLADETDDKAKATLKADIAQLQAEIESLDEEKQKLVASSATNVLQGIKKSEAESAADREAQFHAERVKLQEKDRQVRADLAESLERLKKTNAEGDQLDEALQSLDLAIKALGQIKTVFENTRIYWVAVRDHCAELAREGNTMKDLTDEGLEDMFAEAITHSWYSWLALAKTNYAATVAMDAVMVKVDGVMDDLPTSSEIKKRLEGTINKIKAELLEDGPAEEP